MKIRFAQSLVHLHTGIGLLLLFPLVLAACSLDVFTGNSQATGRESVQTAPQGIQLGVQPCPALVQSPAQWNAIVGLHADETIEHVLCGNLVGLPTLQAVVSVRHTGVDHLLDIFVYSHITSGNPNLLFSLPALLHGDVRISGYNTILTAQADPHSSLNQGLPTDSLEQDLYREFKWSDQAQTFTQVAFTGLFPDLTRFQAEREQRLVNNGQGYQQWRLGVTNSSQTFVNSFLNWPPTAPVKVLSGGGISDYKAQVSVQGPATGDGPILMSFTRLEGNNNGGLWEATSIQTSGLTITSLKAGQLLTSPITITGTNTAFTGKTVIIKILDHVHNAIGHATLPAGSSASFSQSVPYTSSFRHGAQEGIVALYVYNVDGSIAAVTMVKVLLGA